jgi:hypothetical protein
MVESSRSAKYNLKSYRMKSCYTLKEGSIAFAVTLKVKFDDELEAEIEIKPFEGLMLMKLKGFRDPEFKAFSKE